MKLWYFSGFQNANGWIVVCGVVTSTLNSVKLSQAPVEGFTVASVEFGWGFAHMNLFYKVI